MLSVANKPIMLSVIMLNNLMLSVIILNVVAPTNTTFFPRVIDERKKGLCHWHLVCLAQDVSGSCLVEFADQDSGSSLLQIFQVLKQNPGRLFIKLLKNIFCNFFWSSNYPSGTPFRYFTPSICSCSYEIYSN